MNRLLNRHIPKGCSHPRYLQCHARQARHSAEGGGFATATCGGPPTPTQPAGEVAEDPALADLRWNVQGQYASGSVPFTSFPSGTVLLDDASFFPPEPARAPTSAVSSGAPSSPVSLGFSGAESVGASSGADTA